MSIGQFNRHGISLPIDQLTDLCRKYRVEKLAVFGSILRDDFGPDSDVDFLVAFQGHEVGPWMAKLQRMEGELRELLGRKVDLVPMESILQSENWIRKEQILRTAQVIYES